MSANDKLRRLVLCLGLCFGAMLGAPMRPDETEDLMRTMHRTAIVQRLSEDDRDDSGEPLRRAWLKRKRR